MQFGRLLQIGDSEVVYLWGTSHALEVCLGGVQDVEKWPPVIELCIYVLAIVRSYKPVIMHI